MAAALSVPKTISTFVGTPVFLEYSTQTTPGAQQTLLLETVPLGFTRYLHQVVVVCRMEGAFKVSVDGQIVASGRTGAAQANVPFQFTPPRVLVSGAVLEVQFEARPGSPSVDVETFIQASDSES